MSDFTASLPQDAPQNPFDRLCWIMDKLLDPQTGCPWDREQTHDSLKQYLIEESYEVHDAIESGDFKHLAEELGDVALQVVFHSAVAKREKRFGIDDVLEAICAKMIRRHPHVFGETIAKDSATVLEHWEQIKAREKAGKKVDASLVAGIPRCLPALQKAHRMQEKVSRVGFDWPELQGSLEKMREEIDELEHEIREAGKAAPGAAPKEWDEAMKARIFEEMGDLLFSVVNVARRSGVQPEEALQAACAKFGNRFRHIEKRAGEKGVEVHQMTLDEMDAFWNEAKALEKK